MRIWLIGASSAGTEAIRQLQKSTQIDLIVSAPAPDPRAVREGVLDRVDYVETVTPVNVDSLARRIRPDLILIDSSASSYRGRTGGTELSRALTYEIAAASEHPCVVI
jgi:hypothetical protein